MFFQQMIERGKLVIVFLLVAVIVGVLTFFQLPKREIPETSVNIVLVQTPYPGATAETVERNVTSVLETELRSIEGVENVTSLSASEFSNITVEYEDGLNQSELQANVRQAVSDAQSRLPEEALPPTVNDSVGQLPVASYLLTADDRESLETIRGNVDQVEERLLRTSGVSGVTIKGLPETEFVVSLDSEALGERQLAFPDVLTAINEEYKTTPLGRQSTEDGIYQLAIDSLTNVNDMDQVVVGSFEGEPVLLADVGTVEEAPKTVTDLVSLDGKPAVSLTVTIEPGQDIPTLQERIDEVVASEVGDLDSVELVTYSNQASAVDAIFSSLTREFIIAMIAVIVVTTIGLTFTGSLVVSLAIPLSFLLALIPLRFTGVDLNQISIIGAIIALGILVDDAIVVNDNILRRYRKGDSAMLGAVRGTKEVWGSIVTSTLAVVFAFLPLTLLSGANGNFIRALPTVLALSVLASMVISLTLVPIVQYWLNRKQVRVSKREPGWLGGPLNRLSNFYADKLLPLVAKRPWTFGLIGFVITTALYGLILLTPFEFFPAANRPEVVTSVTFPVQTNLEETERRLKQMEAEFQDVDGVVETSVFAGGGLPSLFTGGLDQSGENTGQIVVRVDNDEIDAIQLIDRYTSQLRENYPDAEIFLETQQQGPPASAPVEFTMRGETIDQLVDARDKVKAELETIEGALVLDDIKEPFQTLTYELDREAMASAGVTAKTISDQIRLVTDGVPIGTFDDGIEQRDVKIVIDAEANREALALDDILMPVDTEAGPPVAPLSTFVTETTTEQIQQIPRENGERTVTLRIYPTEGMDEDAFRTDVDRVLEEAQAGLTDEGVSFAQTGSSDTQNEFFIELATLFVVVLFLIFLIIAFQFNSLSLPLLVLFTIYLAIAGAVVGLFVTQTPFSFMASMGMVSLAGIVVRNAVVLFEFIEQGIRQGMAVTTAVYEAGRARIRPILLTALTAVVALLPVALGNDPLFKPLAIGIVSGILFSTILTLVLVPAYYLILAKRRHRDKPFTE
ncbi:efflux RND transporter permease subunit [Exiguobacterium himgiriensis]|uniref:efflux RND transporter permease subunit n=2 Tax=Exiguobacterium TaxID=33986 RepID=UPI001BE81AC2|nr:MULTISPECIES: efflux RND transporter permease subunit [Exiguobacterium]MCT4783016.1 efflux RND transporter permease subunit [Exiguobacterium himgiriensis]